METKKFGSRKKRPIISHENYDMCAKGGMRACSQSPYCGLLKGTEMKISDILASSEENHVEGMKKDIPASQQVPETAGF